MLQEYMKRLIIEQPADPVKFLIHSITVNPFEVKRGEAVAATASTFVPRKDSSAISYSEEPENLENPEIDI